MMAILFATNVLNLMFSFARYLSTAVLSVQNLDSDRGNCSSFFSMTSTFTAKAAAVFGIVVGLRGATLAFP